MKGVLQRSLDGHSVIFLMVWLPQLILVSYPGICLTKCVRQGEDPGVYCSAVSMDS